jgi:hypothetical protein
VLKWLDDAGFHDWLQPRSIFTPTIAPVFSDLYAAAEGGHLDIIEWIVAHPKDPVGSDIVSLETALERAGSGGHARVVCFLEQAQAARAEERTKIRDIYGANYFFPHRRRNKRALLLASTVATAAAYRPIL